MHGVAPGLQPPALDDKVLTGLTGLAIGALASGSRLLGEPEWARVAVEVTEELTRAHVMPGADGSPRLVRASRDGVVSTAAATLEDYGGLAAGLLELAFTTGDERWAELARDLVDACRSAGDYAGRAAAVPGGGDPVLEAFGVGGRDDDAEGAAPSGTSLLASAALTLHHLTGDRAYRALAEDLMATIAAAAVERPLGFGAALGVADALQSASRQLVVVYPDASGPHDPLVHTARGVSSPGLLAITLSESAARRWSAAGFATVAEKPLREGRTTAYLCTDFVCRLPVTDAGDLDLD